MVPPVACHSTVAAGTVSPAAVTLRATNCCASPGPRSATCGATAMATTRPGDGGGVTEVSRQLKQPAAAANTRGTWNEPVARIMDTIEVGAVSRRIVGVVEGAPTAPLAIAASIARSNIDHTCRKTSVEKAPQCGVTRRRAARGMTLALLRGAPHICKVHAPHRLLCRPRRPRCPVAPAALPRCGRRALLP